MRHLRIRAWLCGLLLLLPGWASASPCTTASDCFEWINLASGSVRVMVYRSFPFDSKNLAVTRALIVIHGAHRDADNYFRHALAAAFLSGSLENTVVIAPRFASNGGKGCTDTRAEHEAAWHCAGAARWTAGGGSVDNGSVTSFDVVDQILRRLALKASFPNLEAIVLAGHSAGGQFVSRYGMANQVHEALGVSLTYVVANPSSYAYLDPLRPSVSVLNENVSALAPGYVAAAPANPLPPFIPFSDARNCTTYDNWPYGLQRRVGYAARLSDDQLRKQLAERRTMHLLGGLDILPLFNFDASCPAMAQGPTRLSRGLAYSQYVNERFDAQHRTLVIPACGHNARCMFTDDNALRLLFPKSP